MKTIKAVIGLVLVCLITGGIFRGVGGNCGAAIVYPKAPEGGRRIVYENASSTLRTDPPFLGGFRIEELTIADPYQNYYVHLTNLASGQLLSAAKPGDWTYLFTHGTNAVGAATLIADKKTGKALQSPGLYQSNFSNETLEALRMAQQLPQIQKQDYELRRLDSPPILFVAVWLHGKSDDIIIPLGATFGRWNAYQPYSERQMVKLLEPEAKKKLKQPNLIGRAAPTPSNAASSHEFHLEAYLATLHVGMKSEDAERELKRWGCVPIGSISTAKSHRHSYFLLPDAATVTLQYDKHDELVSWERAQGQKVPLNPMSGATGQKAVPN